MFCILSLYSINAELEINVLKSAKLWTEATRFCSIVFVVSQQELAAAASTGIVYG